MNTFIGYATQLWQRSFVPLRKECSARSAVRRSCHHPCHFQEFVATGVQRCRLCRRNLRGLQSLYEVMEKRFLGRSATRVHQGGIVVSLKVYKQKRDLSRTPEPSTSKRRSGKDPIFVVQEHEASSLHYDFRIEVEGVLKSWAVPKGPSTDPRERRLAIPTEDHPLDYADFEGIIPEGEYGGGTILVWDRGTYENITEKDGKITPMAEALEQGHALIWLHGKKVSGGYALQRIGKGKEVRWLLVKMDDKEADARRDPVSTEPKSVLSERTIEQIAREEAPDEA